MGITGDCERVRETRSIVRSPEGGVWCGTVVNVDGRTVKLKNARMIWHWKGAAGLAELATDGTVCPEHKDNLFTVVVPEVTIFNVALVIPVTQRAGETINAVPVWTSRDNTRGGEV